MRRTFAGGAPYTGAAGDRLTVGEMVPNDERLMAMGGTAGPPASGTLYLAYFTASRTETINTLTSYVGNTAAGATPTLCRMGIYSIASNGDGTLVASIANDTTLWSAALTAPARALTASFSKVQGTRYAIATLIVTAAAVPSFFGPPLQGAGYIDALLGEAPRRCGQIAAQTDLPASFLVGSLANSRRLFAARLS